MRTTRSEKRATAFTRRGLNAGLILLLLCTALPMFAASDSEKESVTPQDVFDSMVQGFRAEKAKDLHARYQFELSGPNGGEWWIIVDDGKCKMGRGKTENPDVTYFVSDQDWVAISNGKLTGWWAYLSGRLKLQGDQKLARKMGELFP